MPKKEDLTNKKFNQLTALRSTSGGKWLWQCDCGSQPKEILSYNVKNGNTKSCGCTRYKFGGKLAQRKCLFCKTYFIPKRSDSNFCSRKCMVEKVNLDRRLKTKEKLKERKCMQCKQFFLPLRDSQKFCSDSCNDRNQKDKKIAINKKIKSKIKRICKYKLCSIRFTPEKRIDQLFCSKRCNLLQGREDYRLRNKEKVAKSRNLRLRWRYKNDPEYYAKRKKRKYEDYHSLSKSERKELGKNNRERLNKDNRKSYMRNYHSNRSKTDPGFRLLASLRARVRSYLKTKNIKKLSSTKKLIGCSIHDLQLHLEKQFKENMNWDNYGKDGWHLDHIRPCSRFDENNKEEMKVCFNWRNLQPLWSSENLEKKNDYSPLDEVAWVERMQALGYKGELFLKFEEGNSY